MSSITRGNKLPRLWHYREWYEWQCDGCGLVWDRKWHAENCESRKHIDSFTQSYSYRLEGFETHGKYGQNVYTRRAIRRA